uniref:O-methyltransferase, family 3 n=1 Tax=Solibacter usitatus (strain Ellin6076) TaxID=234267 RepID=Q025T5_SOLUE
MAINPVRPFRIFQLIESLPAERIAKVPIPSHRGAGGLTLLETFLTIAAARIVAARRIFEFGTYLGATTLNLALNTPEDAEIFTLDLDERHAEELIQDAADATLTKSHISAARSLDYMDIPAGRKVKALMGDSTKFDFSDWKGSMDLIFVDGGHDLATVTSDTTNALNLADPGKLSCIIWHDYGNPQYVPLTSYLDELSERLQIFHIEDTMLCVWFNDPLKSIGPRLLNLQ